MNLEDIIVFGLILIGTIIFIICSIMYSLTKISPKFFRWFYELDK